MRSAKQSERINHIEQVRPYLKQYKLSNNQKGLAFTRTLKGMKSIEKIALEEGFNPICIWSTNNGERELSKEQLRVKEVLLHEGELIEPYDFLIINSVKQDKWVLNDKQFKLVIMNTINEVEKVQALSRYKNDIDILVYRVRQKPSTNPLDLNEKYLNRSLTTEDKECMCLDLGVISKSGSLAKWPAIKKMLISQNYRIKDTVKTISGKRTRVSIITI